MQTKKMRVLSAFLAALMLWLTTFPGWAAESATAAAMQLMKTEGAVNVANGGGMTPGPDAVSSNPNSGIGNLENDAYDSPSSERPGRGSANDNPDPSFGEEDDTSGGGTGTGSNNWDTDPIPDVGD